MKIITSSILWSLLFHSTIAMYADEAGVNDFTIASAGHGHGGVTYAQMTSDGKAILTSSSTPSFDTFSTESSSSLSSSLSTNTNISNKSDGGGYDGCYLASRSLDDGSLLWRKNVCSSNIQSKTAIRHAVYSNPNDMYVYTLDDAGMLRKWDETNGNLLHQVSIGIGDYNHLAQVQVQPPQIYALSSDKLACVIGNEDGGRMVFYDSKEMKMDESKALLASTILQKAKVKSGNSKGDTATSPQFLSVLDEEHVLVGFVDAGTTSSSSLSQMAIVNVLTMEAKSVSAPKLGSVPLVVSTIKARSNENDEQMIIALSSEEKVIISYNLSSRKEINISVNDINNNISSTSSDDLVSIYKEMNGVVANGVGLMNCNDKTIKISNGKLITNSERFQSVALYDNEQSDTVFLKMLHCDNNHMTGLAMLRGGTTSVFDVVFNEESIVTSVERNWSAEEAFGSVSSTTFLDFNSPQGTTTSNDDEEDAVLASLSFASRLNAQFESLVSLFSGGFMERASNLLPSSDAKTSFGQKDLVFGLKKVAVMLSNPFSKVLSIDTASKGAIIWSMNLNPQAVWHKVVHGAASSRTSAFGHGMHHPHSPELLILSQLSDSVEWKCVDGLRGRTISESKVDLSSPVVQILPIHAHSHAGGGCKQNAILILEDKSFVIVPQTSQSVSDAYKVIQAGLYSHTVNKETGLFTSMKLGNDSQTSIEIGETLFDPKMEKIVNVAYPQRNEVVQSPSTILGDDSLLLKYLNPHICVIVTEATEEMINELDTTEENSFYDALASSKSGEQKKKPVGVTKPGEETSTTSKELTPTLFINLVDTVSGQILHRTSHVHVAPGAMLANDATVPVVISENWIVYAFTNARTRRTELGVITLHEGMIDKKGITAFSTPEQQETFSSLTSDKPYVITKTFAVSVPVSAIGVTNTKNGISSKNILLATGPGGKVIRVDRRLLDPRRPSGEPKDSEKKEGLMQYSPFLPIPPVMTQSYTNTIEEVSSIQSTAANLESQTLVIAYGGPDIFFTRYAPSKGFDSLPENFNKFAIIMVLIALYGVMQYLKKAGQKKRVELGWS